MIAGVDRQTDITIYFQEDEVKALFEGQEIAGILIRTAKPHQQGTITAKIDNDRQNMNGFGIGIESKDYWDKAEGFNLDIFIGDYYFSRLQEMGKTGTRQSLRDGSKISLHSPLGDSCDFEIAIDTLEFYRDNKGNFLKRAEQGNLQ